MIDGKAYKATAEKQKSEANQAVYNVAVPEIGFAFHNDIDCFRRPRISYETLRYS